ncbi:MAG: peroxiredoxin family protein [Gammaproteobacteria bacterium]
MSELNRNAKMKAEIGKKSPSLAVSEWVQGEPVNLDQLLGKVVLVEVFQVNCPGCFLYALPQAIDWHRQYSDQGLVVLGLATAFEDFDKNNLDNLIRLVESGEVIGETLRILSERGELIDGRWSYRIPFSVAMDRLTRCSGGSTAQDVESFIEKRVPDFELQSELRQQQIRQAVQQYFNGLEYHAETFEAFDLQGTPSHILIDKQGILREYAFGNSPELEARIQELLQEE